MQTYICLLRSINVAGTNIIKMAALKLFWENLGYTNVTTYIQSGNIIFTSATKPNEATLEKLIEEKFATKNASVIIKTPAELANIIVENPYQHSQDFDVKKMYVCYFQNQPTTVNIDKLNALDFGTDTFTINNNVMYIYYGESAGKSKLTNKVIEKHLNIATTARNWNTTNKLMLLAE